MKTGTIALVAVLASTLPAIGSAEETGEAAEGSAPQFVVGAEGRQGLAAVWNGFEMEWEYNHRVNRLGSLLELETCSAAPGADAACRARLTVAAASGTGPDKARIATRVSMVRATDVAFHGATREVLFIGPVDQPVAREFTIEVPLGEWAAGQTVHHAVLNGLDILSLDDADKFIGFELGIDSVTVDAERKVATVTLVGAMTMSCRTAECSPNRRLDYSVLVGVLVASGSAGSLNARASTASTEYAWNNKTELDRDVPRVALAPEGEQRFGTAVTGVTRLAMNIGKEMHMLRWGVLADNNDEAVLPFKNWQERMVGAHPPESWFAFREEGEAVWEGSFLRLEFADADVSTQRLVENISWPGWNAKGTSARGDDVGPQSQMLEFSLVREGAGR